MEITPAEIEARQFRTSFKGYDPEEVDAFLDEVAAAMSALHNRLRERGELLAALQAQVEDGERVQGQAEGLVEAARSAAAAIVAKAEGAAAARRRDAETALGDLADGLAQLRGRLNQMTAAQVAAIARIEDLLRRGEGEGGPDGLEAEPGHDDPG